MGHFTPLAPIGPTVCAVWGMPLVALFCASLLAGGLHPRSFLEFVFKSAFFRFFGRYSYGLYIFHYLFAELAVGFRPIVLLHLHSKALAVAVPASVALLATILTALLSFHFYEKRFLTLKRFFADHSRRPKLETVVHSEA
jgi:peptidoglycan/LPS O-acetylase OafA/YrhL